MSRFYLASEASSRTSISARNVAKTSFRMVIPSFAASAVPSWKGDRARSLYPHSPRPATLCQAACAYPELFAVVGGQTPDLRGLFLRGHGGNSAALGVQQGDAIRNVTGTFDARVAGMWREGTGPFRVGGGGGQKVAVDGYGYPYDVSFDLSRCVPTASENRPVNTAVRYLIRAHP